MRVPNRSPQRGFLSAFNLIDALVIFLAAFWIIALSTFVYKTCIRHTTLSLESVTPQKVVAGRDLQLSIMGNGFDVSTTIQLGNLTPSHGILVNEARIDIPLPENILPGKHRLIARNGQGRMVIREDLFEVFWIPQVHAVQFLREDQGEAVFEVIGKYLEIGCRITVAGMEVKHVDYPSSEKVIIRLPSSLFEKGTAGEIFVVNPSQRAAPIPSLPPAGSSSPSLRNPSIMIPPPVSIQHVLPQGLEAREKITVVLVGESFRPGCSVYLDDIGAEGVEWVDPQHVVAIFELPWIFPGSYSIRLVNPDGQFAVFRSIHLRKMEKPKETEGPRKTEGPAKTGEPALRESWSSAVIRIECSPSFSLDQLKSSTLFSRPIHPNRIWFLSILAEHLPKSNVRSRSSDNKGWLLAHVLLPTKERKSRESWRVYYLGHPLEQGSSVWFKILPKKPLVCGKVVSGPFPLDEKLL